MARPHFHEELEAIELEILGMGELAERAVARSVEALVRGDVAEADDVISHDDDIDERYMDIEARALGLLALQTPVATDLRMISAIIHINLHLERIGEIEASWATGPAP